MEIAEQLFLSFSLNPKVVESILKNGKVTQKLSHLIGLSGKTQGNKVVGDLLYYLSTKLPPAFEDCEKFLVDKVVKGDLLRKDQVDAAIAYLKKFDSRASINEAEFNSESGVGVVVTEAEIKALVDQIYAKHNEEI